MLKRTIAAFQKRFLSAHATSDPKKKEVVHATRRAFFTRATLGAASISGGAGLAKMAIDSAPQPDMQDLYEQDAHKGESELMEREYVLMSEQEKAGMVQMFVDNYSDKP